MKPIYIGQSAINQPLFITPAMRQSTHMHVIGGSGTGKSKFLEWLIRKDIRESHGLCVLDWHGTLYQDVLNYCAQLRVGTSLDPRQLILINPSKPDYITGYNPFVNQGDDISVQVQRRIDATIRPWGITDTNLLPTFERVCRVIYGFAVEKQETLPIAAMLLKYKKPELREFALKVLTHPYFRDQCEELQNYKTIREWRDFVLSTENRFGRFLSSTTIRRFIGMSEHNINLLEAMDQGKIVLVNLGSSGFLDRESARVFASLFLNEFFETAMLRAQQARQRREGKPKTFVLYMDEFQEYITEDVAAMLDQVRKGGLHMVLAHQHLGHLADNPRLRKSIFTNARVRAVFGGLDFEDSTELANEMFLPDLNTRQIKKAYYHTTHLYREETRKITSRSKTRSTTTARSEVEGRGSSWGSSGGSASSIGSNDSQTMSYNSPGMEGWFTSQSASSSRSTMDSWSDARSEFSARGYSEAQGVSETEGDSTVPVWVPIPVEEIGSEAEWSLEEKRSKTAQMLKEQMQRHCFIKLDTEKTQPLLVPFVKEFFHPPNYLLRYEEEVYKAQGALPAAQVDQLLIDREQKFLTEARQVIDIETEPQSDPIEEPWPKVKRSARTRVQKPKPKSTIYDNVDLDQDKPDD